MASRTVYTCDFCGAALGARAGDVLAVRVVRANSRERVEAEGDCCTRCEQILAAAMRAALRKCQETSLKTNQ